MHTCPHTANSPQRAAILIPPQEILNYYRVHGYENIKCSTASYNKELKELVNPCGITKNVNSYVARHSFANCLKQKGVATDVISESLGHQNLAVTQAYLKELDTEVVDKALEVLL